MTEATPVYEVERDRACPFCGGDPEIDTNQYYRSLSTGEIGSRVVIYCTNCDAEIGFCTEDAPDVDPTLLLHDVLGKWNNRPDPWRYPPDMPEEGQLIVSTYKNPAAASESKPGISMYTREYQRKYCHPIVRWMPIPEVNSDD